MVARLGCTVIWVKLTVLASCRDILMVFFEAGMPVAMWRFFKVSGFNPFCSMATVAVFFRKLRTVSGCWLEVVKKGRAGAWMDCRFREFQSQKLTCWWASKARR